ncbi:RNA polymerase sigma factor SigF [Kitasatospora nipponensis]|uniref:RNA polymerase sigma factor SigF n=1 Tax=Kitasatospora nipponensis TaxID=258049 RepID=A0ABN1WIW3_9ACTN
MSQAMCPPTHAALPDAPTDPLDRFAVSPRPTSGQIRAMGKSEVRELSDALFRRLAELPPEHPAHGYVRGTLIELNMSLVRFVASRFRHRSAEMADVLQVGTVGLIKAVDGYRYERGVEFLTYAIPTISGEIKRYFRDTSWPVRVPRSVQELYLAVVRGSDRLEQDLGRGPTQDELAAELDLTREEVETGQVACSACRADSLDALHDDGSDPAGSTLLDHLGACDQELELVEFRTAVRPLLSALPERERRILLLRFWGDHTQSEIAQRLGISQMHVSRLLGATLALLREQLEDTASLEDTAPTGRPTVASA